MSKIYYEKNTTESSVSTGTVEFASNVLTILTDTFFNFANGDILTASSFNIIDGWIDYVKL